MGLDAAGKTTILYKMKLGEVVTTIPTIGINVETINLGRSQITMWDFGGREKIRSLFKFYYENTQAVIVVIDSADPDRFDEIKEVLEELNNEELSDAVVLYFANKQELLESVIPTEIINRLELQKTKQNWSIQPCPAITGDGLKEGFNWIVKN
eukprot:gene10498-3019_t